MSHLLIPDLAMASCSEEAPDAQEVQAVVRKLRKKLRQIEHLERLDRELNNEEMDKLSRKEDIRADLARKLAVLGEVKVVQNHFNNSYNSELEISEVSQPQDNLEPDPKDVFENFSSSHKCSTPKKETENVVKVVPGVAPNKIIDKVFAPTSASFEKAVTPTLARSPDSVSSQRAATRRSKGKGNGPAAGIVSPDARSVWMERGVVVTTLAGHFDVICSLDTNGSILMTGSRDTTVKVWCLHSLTELRSMGGHAAAVTCVKILPWEEELQGLEDSLDATRSSPPSQLGISGALDCQVNIWDLESGQKLGHIYTFSSVTCLEYYQKRVITGSDGGKVEIWDLQTRQSLHVLRGPSKGVTCMYLDGCKLYVGDSGGTIEVWSVASQDNQDELVVPAKPDLRWDPAEVGVTRTSGGQNSVHVPFFPCCVRCIAAYKGRVYWGDDGTNIKVLQCETGIAHRLTNHTHRFGSTGGIAVYPRESILLAAGYDLDTGNASINVRSIPSESYLCSVSTPDQPTPYISCIITTTSASSHGEMLRICTGGNELKIWDVTPVGKLPEPEDLPPHRSHAHCSHDSSYNTSFYTDTESEEDGFSDDDSLSSPTLHTRPLPHITHKGNDIVAVQRRESWLWWLCKCNIL